MTELLCVNKTVVVFPLGKSSCRKVVLAVTALISQTRSLKFPPRKVARYVEKLSRKKNVRGLEWTYYRNELPILRRMYRRYLEASTRKGELSRVLTSRRT